MRRAHTWAVLACLSSLSAACPREETSEPLTEVLVQIYADEVVQKAGDTLVVEFMSGPKASGELSPSDPETFDLSKEDFRWPVSMALVAKSAHEDYAFELNLRLEKQGVVLAHGRVQSYFVKGRTVVLQTSLGAECLGKLDCPDNETCVVNNGRAACQSASVDSGDLPDVHDAPKSNDAGTAPLDAGPIKISDAGKSQDAGSSKHDAGAQHDAAAHDASATDAGSCTPSTEDCTNGLDDDCNGAVDCADSACQEISRCVPNAIAFAVVDESEDCPEGYDFFDVMFQELQNPGCAGCSCQPVQKECNAYVAIYDNSTVCERDAQPYSGGQALKDPATGTCSLPIGKQIDLTGSVLGFRVSVKGSGDACTVSGTASPIPPTWNVKRKRCSAQLRRNGCQFGAFCAPIQKVQQLCWQPGTAGCGNAELARTYFQSFEDRRSCTPCSCSAKNGSCKDVGATLTDDTRCALGTAPVLTDGQKTCMTIPADATARSVGKPRDPFCTTGTNPEGSLVPRAPVNLCCGP